MEICQPFRHQDYASYKEAKRSGIHVRRASTGTVALQELQQDEECLAMLSQSTVATKSKPVGKIIKNKSTATSENRSIYSPINTVLHPQGQAEPMQRYRDEIMTKIRASQLSNYNKRPLQVLSTNIQPQADLIEKKTQDYQGKLSSVSGKYELKIDVVLGSYETRKQQIDDKINMLRKNRALSLASVPFQDCKTADLKDEKEQTPKFATSLTKKQHFNTQKQKIKPCRGPRWQQFVSAFRQQIELQEQLRTAKHKVKQSDKPKLQSLLSQNRKISNPEVLILESEQFDPFFQAAQSDLEKLAKELAEAWQKCENHWRQHIKSRFDKELLDRIYSELQGQKQKGAVSLKGFVREFGVMLQNEKYLRNRDLFRIYKRIWPFSREKFIAELGNPYV